MCPTSIEDAKKKMAKGAGPRPTHSYQVVGQCLPASDGEYPACDLHPCPASEGGFYYSLQESPIAATPPQWTHIAYVCLDDPEELIGISAATAAREFKRLTWPAGNLAIQPPDGETLVNLPTIFMATNPEPVTQTITLLGQTLQIEATPVEWTWHWAQPGDGATTDDLAPYTTSDPGAPHPDATITHAYRRADLTVRPSLDVTYEGRYRVNDGAWQPIPEPRTIPGTPGQTLTVLEARPTLVR